jgi:hypothetical protein
LDWYSALRRASGTGCKKVTARAEPALIGISTEERVTLDYQVVARDPRGKRLDLAGLAIIEVKQPSLVLGSPVMQVVRGQGLKQCAFSKYAVATALAGAVPCNRFKPTLRALERISS